MSLLFHLLKNDLRHTRWSLLAWSLAQLLVTATGLSLWYAPGFFIEHPNLVQPAIGLASFILLFVTYDFGVRIVQADNPCVPHAFWRTRPIRPLRLLTAKLLTLLAGALLAALPSASIFLTHRLVENLPFDFTPLLSIWLTQLPFLALALLFASFTPTTRHCLFATILALVAFAIWTGTSAIPTLTNADTGLTTSRIYLGASLLLVTAAAALLHQYRTARFRRSLTILGLGLTATFTTPYWWHLPLSVHETVAPETESSLTREITLSNAQLIDTTIPRRTRYSRFSLQLDLPPPPPGHLFQIESVHQHWPTGDITAEQRITALNQIPDEYARPALFGHDFTADEPLRYTLSLPRDSAATLRNHGATRAFTAEYTIALTRPEPVFTLPLRNPGHTLAPSPETLARVVTIDPAKNAIWVSTLDLPRHETTRNSTRQLGFISVRAPSTYFLVHRPTAEAIYVYAARSTTTLGVKLTLFNLGESSNKLTDPLWLEDCEIVEIAPRLIARFTRTYSAPTPASP